MVERLALLDTLVFDKTGTLTDPANASIEYFGEPLSSETQSILKAMVARSTHPLSNRINLFLTKADPTSLANVQEIKGSGILADYKNQEFRLGSQRFAGGLDHPIGKEGNHVYLSVEGVNLGYFHIQSGLREGAVKVVNDLIPDYELHVLSGDHAHERESLIQRLSSRLNFNFEQSPKDKLNYLKALNKQEKKYTHGRRWAQ
ncbi:HAD family hydrolase [Algoriphagus boritolerans]|uniref:HAD family hydrolase n=1 Tax=Algoriphagus boritolerans TaxID=308111 RepID=UPI000A659DD8